MARSSLSKPRCAIKRALAALYTQSLAEHGVEPSATVLALLAMDIELNAQGMAVWLDREVKQAKT